LKYPDTSQLLNTFSRPPVVTRGHTEWQNEWFY